MALSFLQRAAPPLNPNIPLSQDAWLQSLGWTSEREPDAATSYFNPDPDRDYWNDYEGYGGYQSDFYNQKYGIPSTRRLDMAFRSSAGQIPAYEELLRINTDPRNLISSLPTNPFSEDRIQELIRAGLSSGTRTGFNSAFEGALTPQELGVITQYRNYQSPDDFFTTWGPVIGSLAFGGLIGATGGLSGAGLDAYAGAAGSGAGAAGGAINAGGLDGLLGDSVANYTAGMGTSNALTGGGMGFFDDILNLANPSSSGFDFSNILSDTGSFAGEFNPLSTDWESLLQTVGSGNATLGGVFNSLTGGNLPSLGNTLRNLLSGGAGTGSGGNLLSSLFGGGSGSGGFNLAAIAPSLAAINYARNQDPFDTSRLESLYGQVNPSANAFQYDTNTGLGREELTSSLARRGISGSSFGDQSLTNFNTFRDLGRQSLLNQGIGTQADIASKILSSDVASRQMKNDLYGRALLALSGGLSPTNTSAFFGR